MWEEITGSSLAEVFGGGIIGALMALWIGFVLILLVGIYVYHALAWMTIGKKLDYKIPWLAWIPVANIAMILQIGSFHWAWVFLILVPIAGWIALLVLQVIAVWRMFVKRKYPGWFSLAQIIPQVGGVLYLIAIGFAAWGKK